MKPILILPALTFLSWICTVGSSQAQLTINYDFASGANVPDGFGQLSDVKTLGGLSGLTSFSGVVTRLNLANANENGPMYLGDLYSSLTFGTSEESQRIAVLLNRAGRNNTDAFGSSLSSFNVTLAESASTNVWGTTSSTGTYQADGRLGVNPASAGVAFAAGSNGLTALNGSQLASNRVSLLVADFSQGGTATLAGWGVSVTGTAASSGTFTPGAKASISDTGSGATNTVGATLNTTGADSGALVVNFAGSTTFSGGVTGSGGLTKTGTGTLTLGGVNDYTGATSVTDGKLVMTSTTGSSPVTVSGSGVILATGTTATIGSSLVVGNGAILAVGDAANASTANATVTGATTFNNGSIFSWDINSAGTSYDKLVSSNLVDGNTVGGAIFRIVAADSTFANTFWKSNQTWTDIFTTNGFAAIDNWATIFGNSVSVVNSNFGSITPVDGLFSVSGSTLTWTAVPEPSSALAGLLIAAGLLRRRRVA